MIMDMEEPVEVVVELVDQEGWPTDGWTANRQNQEEGEVLVAH